MHKITAEIARDLRDKEGYNYILEQIDRAARRGESDILIKISSIHSTSLKKLGYIITDGDTYDCISWNEDE